MIKGVKQPLFSGQKQILKPTIKPKEYVIGENRTGLVGYWNDDGKSAATWLDQADSHLNNGTIYGAGTPPSATIGALGYVFDGVDDYVNVGNANSLNITGTITITAWIKSNGTQSISRGLVTKYSSTNLRAYALSKIADARTVSWNYQRLNTPYTAGDTLVSNSSLSDSVYTFVAVTFTPSVSAIIYFNGVQDAIDTTDIQSAIASTTASLEIGRQTDVSTYFNGSIDEVRIYNRALSASEINYLYQKYRIKFGV